MSLSAEQKKISAMGLCLFLMMVSGCSEALQIPGSCGSFVGEHHIEYVGGALGEGKLDLRISPERSDALVGRLTLWDETGTDAVLELSGPGVCEGNLIRLTFGAGDHPQSLVRVLGGTAMVVPPVGRVPELFGRWDVEIVVKEDGSKRALRGFLRAISETTASGDEDRSPRNPEQLESVETTS